MGFGTTKKVLTVSSTLYNLAGDIEGRPNFLKSNMFGHMVGKDGKGYLGEHLTENYLRGPGIAQRNYQSWAVRQNFSGLPSYGLGSTSKLDTSVVKNEIPNLISAPSSSVTVQSVLEVDGQFVYFAEKHILDTYPDRYNTNWTCDYDVINHEITIQYADLTTETIDAGDFDPSGKYIIAYYYHEDSNISAETIVESATGDDSHPDPAGYNSGYLINYGPFTSTDLFETVTEDRTYSDSTPPVSTSTTSNIGTGLLLDEYKTYIKDTYYGNDGGSITVTTDRAKLYIDELKSVEVVTTVTTTTNDLGGGVTETVTTTTDTDTVVSHYDWSKTDSVITEGVVVDGYKLFIYKLGSGNANLDAYLNSTVVSVAQEYFPFIPVRLNNVSMKDEKFDSITGNGLYEESRKAYRKSFGENKYEEMIDKVEDNDSIADIDFAYICHGVPLNVIENSSRKYIYEYFKNLIPIQVASTSEVTSFSSRVAAHEAALAVYSTWTRDQENATPGLTYGDTRPELPVLQVPARTEVRLFTDNAITSDYDMRMSWVNISESSHTGLGKVDAKKGELWFETGTSESWTYHKGPNMFDEEDPWLTERVEMETIYLFYQDSDTTYKKLTVYGLQHDNFVYQGKSVTISGIEALNDEDESGFLVPLHRPTLVGMSLVDSTQMATANTYIVFNSYQITKTKWYQSSIFKVIIIIAIVVLTIVTGGGLAGLGSTVGLLGANAAVGATLGLTGVAAALAGAAVNALAAMILTKVITLGATELFGEQLGQIIGAIVSLVTLQLAAGNFGSMDFSNIMSARNLLGMTNALANGYKAQLQGEIGELSAALEETKSRFEENEDFISEMLLNLGGINDLNFDPLSLTNANNGNDSSGFSDYTPETLDEFIHRTQLVGSDVTEITFSLIHDFPELANALPRS